MTPRNRINLLYTISKTRAELSQYSDCMCQPSEHELFEALINTLMSLQRKLLNGIELTERMHIGKMKQFKAQQREHEGKFNEHKDLEL